jgi:hypothetical protein
MIYLFQVKTSTAPSYTLFHVGGFPDVEPAEKRQSPMSAG